MKGRADRAMWPVALVTGASSGIGRGIAIELSRAGMSKTIVLAARRKAQLEEVAHEVEQAGARAIVEALDLGDTDHAAHRMRALDDELGGIDLVVANAGVGAPPNEDPIAWESVRDAFHINVCGAVATLTTFAPRMRDRRRGHLVGIGSISSFGALPAALAYSAPKAALSMVLDCLRLDLAAARVTVTSVHLGFVRTNMVSHSTHPLPQLMEVEPLARELVRRLQRHPRAITLPRATASLARGLAALPESLRETIASYLSKPRAK